MPDCAEANIQPRFPSRGLPRSAVRSVGPLLGAGSAFAGLTLLGFAAGVALGERGGPWCVLGGLVGGMLLGGYSAYRLLAKAL